MASPVIVNTPQREWTLVASATRTGIIDRLQTGFDYYQTYRCTGDIAPDTPVGSKVPDEAVVIFDDCDQVIIDSSVSIDVYIYCNAKDGGITRDGQVRVNSGSTTARVGRMVLLRQLTFIPQAAPGNGNSRAGSGSAWVRAVVRR